MPLRPSWPVAAIVLLLTAPAVAAPQGRAVEVENVRVGFEETYKIGAWTPVVVQARAGVEPFEGTMEVVVADESGTPVVASQPVRIGAGDSTKLVAYTRFGSPSGGLTVRFVRDGKRVASVDLDAIRPNNPPNYLFSEEVVILGLGKPQGVELIPGLPRYNGARAASGGSTGGALSVEVIRPQGLGRGDLPGRAIGYDAFDAIVVDTNDRELMTELATKGEALKQWVGQGGHLVVAVGANWQALRDSVLGPMLPASPVGTIPISDVRTIEAFAGATNQLPVEESGLTIARLEEDKARAAKVLCATSTTPIIVRGAYGFGRVTVVALDVDGGPFASWPDRGLFWVRALDLHPPVSAGSQSGRITQSTLNDLSGRLREALEQFPGVKLIPFGWVAFFIFLYILLIGPGDYLFLRRVVKRMEMTWITFPTIVVLVSALAYWAAYRAKGTELRVNQVDVVDVDIPAKLVRGATFVNVFSPQNRDYDVAVVPKPVEGSGSMPPGTETRLSWFASPDMGLRGMGGGGRALAFGSEGYRYAPEGRAERLEGVRIPIWSTKAFAARWYGPATAAEPIIESDLTPLGLDRLNGTITNRLGVPLKGAVLAFGSQVYYNLGTIAPGESKQVELTQDRKLAGHLKDLVPSYLPATAGHAAGGPINRYGLMQAILFHESDTSGTNPLPSRPLHDLDLTGQLLLDRPMLVAEIDRPVTELDLGTSSGPPNTERTTVIRVILPLKR
jgi:hypothetical protein